LNLADTHSKIRNY